MPVEATTAPKEAVNRKCPYCSAEIPTPNPPAVTLGGPLGAHWRRDKKVPRFSTPTSGTRARPPNAPQPEVRARPPPRALLRVAQPVPPGSGEDSTPGTSRSTWSRGTALQRLPKGLGYFPNSRTPPRTSPSRPRSYRPAGGSRHPCRGFRRATLPRGDHYLSGKTPNSSRGHAPLSPTPAGATCDPSRALGTPPRQRQFFTGQKCPGASRDSRLRAPRPAPAARAASAPRSRTARPGTHRQLGRRSGEARGGPGKTQYGRAPQLLPVASSSRLREDAATSRQRQLRWRPRQHHIPLRLASSPSSPRPAAMATRRLGDWPRPLFRPRLPRPPRRGLGPPIPVPSHLLRKGRLRQRPGPRMADKELKLRKIARQIHGQ
ncbi:translation initiation factor IF-2-like [Sciurus carolinensis]|uniref:translation initiation factor IF-2-like n=1 Tax=Sciurus carolinensis TaxID=30640 RepID=UPI001FB2A764|nr:translation initiation factor IF-2-like [Sciurus carolinensis]